MSATRMKLLLLLAGIAFSCLALLSWTQEWFALTLPDGAVLSVTGEVAAPALTALALTGLVLVGALSIAGPFFRVILGSTQALLGFTVSLSAAIAIANPLAASAASITAATGVSGELAGEQVDVTTATAWPWVALVAGALIVATGILVVATARRWPGATRKYQAVRLEPAEGSRTAVDDWDALSDGDDPTR